MRVAILASSSSIHQTCAQMLRHADLELAEDVHGAQATLHYADNQFVLRRTPEIIEWALPAPQSPHSVIQALQQTAQKMASGGPYFTLAYDWQFDRSARALRRDDEMHTLTEKESLLLQTLLKAYPAACRREQLLKEIWSYDEDIETHTLETHVYRLRSKLGELRPKPCDILTMDGAYCLLMELL